MTRELRTIILALLTLLIYALSYLVTHRSLIFPFPMNEAVFAIVLLQFCYWERHLKLKLLFPVGIAFLAIMTSPVFWEIVIPLESYHSFVESGIMDLARLLFLISMVFSGVAMVRQQEKWQVRFLGIFGLGFFIIGYTVNESWHLWYEFPGTILIALSVLLEPTYKPFNLLWVLLAGLEGTKVMTYLFA